MNFQAKYTLAELIGKGAFSSVYRCFEKEKPLSFAAKIIDLRPLRLRENFDIKRLMREVNIMEKVEHPNVIRLYEVFEEKDFLIMILEYVPGVELFDAIIARAQYTETDARPIFQQLAAALAFLHSKSIIHRDVKPENCIITEDATGAPLLKLLDFGLATSSDYGSTAKTFVGTPCYLAPEIELARGGSEESGYGTQVDAWSLGATLHVMLVARFPEFDRSSGLPLVKTHGAVWEGISGEAKSLIRRLMAPKPNERLTTAQALEDVWVLGPAYQAAAASAASAEVATTTPSTQAPPPGGAIVVYNAPKSPARAAEGGDRLAAAALTPTGGELSSSDLVPAGPANNAYTTSRDQLVAAHTVATSTVSSPLIVLLRRTCELFEAAVAAYPQPDINRKIRERALLGRALTVGTIAALERLSLLADQILKGLPDVLLAVQEEEPALAMKILQGHRKYILELRSETSRTMETNNTLIRSINSLLVELNGAAFALSPRSHISPIPPCSPPENSTALVVARPQPIDTTVPMPPAALTSAAAPLDCPSVPVLGPADDFLEMLAPGISLRDAQEPSRLDGAIEVNGNPLMHLPLLLQEIDRELEASSSLWAKFELVFDLALQKGDFVEQFVEFTKKPRLMERFQIRMAEYEKFLSQVRQKAGPSISEADVMRIFSFASEVN